MRKKYVCTIFIGSKVNPHKGMVDHILVDIEGKSDNLIGILERTLRNYELPGQDAEIVGAYLKEGKNIIASYLCPRVARKDNLDIDERRNPKGYYKLSISL